MPKSILLNEFSEQEVKDIFSALIRAELETLRHNLNCFGGDELMTRSQAASYLHIDLSTLTAWSTKNKIPVFSIQGRRYYKKHQLLQCLEPVNDLAKDSL